MGALRRFRPPRQLAPKRMRLVVFLLVLVAAGLLLMFVVKRQYWHQKVTTDAFWAAYRGNNAERVLALYDEAKRERDSAEAGSDRQISGDEVVRLAEATVSEKARGIVEGLARGDVLQPEDKKYLSSYNALSAQAVLESFLSTAYGFLQGNLDDASMQHFLEQSLQIDAIYVTYARVGLEFPSLIAAKEKIGEAETAMKESRWHDATTLWQELAEDDETSHFVRGFVDKRFEDARTALRTETIRTINHFMSQKRLYSAQKTLNKVLPIFPFDQELLSIHQQLETSLPKDYDTWDMAVEYLAVRPLIQNAAVAFDGDAYADAANRYLLLTGEFTRMLDALYRNDYVLVSPRDFIAEDGTFRTFEVPAGKTPLVLVLDSYHFAPTRLLNGTVNRLGLDEAGNVAGVVVGEDQTETIDRSSEAVGLLEQFLEAHPDFSFNGARGVVAVNGATGIFGIITNERQAVKVNEMRVRNGLMPTAFDDSIYEANRKLAAAVAERMKETGWLLASNAISDKPLPEASVEEIETDSQTFKSQVSALIGPSDIFVYPAGEHVNNDDEKTSLLVREGYRQLIAYGDRAYFAYGEGYVHVDMTLVGGEALRRPDAWRLDRFFDAGTVYDAASRP